MKKRLVAAGVGAMLGVAVSAAPAQAVHGDYYTRLKCVIGAGTLAVMDVSMTDPEENRSLITREDFSTTPAFRPDKVQLMLAKRHGSTLDPYATIYTWGTGASRSVSSSFGSTALALDPHYYLKFGYDELKMKLTSGNTTVECHRPVGEGHA